MSLEIVERVVAIGSLDDYGVAWDEPFIHLTRRSRN